MDNEAYHQTFTDTGDGSNGQFGNMSCAPAGPGCVAFTYSASTNRITTSGYSYDAAGNVTGDGTRTYQWDAESHLTVAYVSGIAVQTNTYNALGQRVRDVTQSATTDEAYGAGGNLLWRYTGNSSTNRSFVPFNGGILAEYWSGGTILDHPDEIGSATTSSDYTGNNFNEKLYYPFGEAWTGAAIPNFNMHQTFAQLPDYDSETDQYNTANRHYSPSGRWMSPDPGGMKVIHLDAPQTWNLYAYVANNPTTTADPSGLDPTPPPVDQDALKKCDPDTECNIVENKLKFEDVLMGIGIGLYNTGADMLNLVLQADYHAPPDALLPEVLLEGVGEKVGAVASAGVFFMIPGGGEEEAAAQGAELASRAGEIQSTLKGIAQEMRTTAVADATLANGSASRLVASSENSLAPAQRAALREGEVAVSGKGHAEQKIASWAEKNGAKINAIGASRPICTSCQAVIRALVDVMFH